METFFNIYYEFDKPSIFDSINKQLTINKSNYICVADGNILRVAHQDIIYRNIINGGLFSICDSSWVPLFIKWIYGYTREQYCGAMIFKDIIASRKYRMYFMGTSKNTLTALQNNLIFMNPEVKNMTFCELPFCDVDGFDYPAIAKVIESDKADIVWVALGAPKQEIFMSKLKPYLNHGVMIAVGAAFKFYSGQEEKRAPEWMRKRHLEFIFRIYSEPKKQLRRCVGTLIALPSILHEEWGKKKNYPKMPPIK